MANSRRSGQRAKGSAKRKGGAHRPKPERREPYRWLGAGAVTLGLGVALASGAGVAHADDASSGSSGSGSRCLFIRWPLDVVGLLDVVGALDENRLVLGSRHVHDGLVGRCCLIHDIRDEIEDHRRIVIGYHRRDHHRSVRAPRRHHDEGLVDR